MIHEISVIFASSAPAKKISKGSQRQKKILKTG
jgi:hypothetical protein